MLDQDKAMIIDPEGESHANPEKVGVTNRSNLGKREAGGGDGSARG